MTRARVLGLLDEAGRARQRTNTKNTLGASCMGCKSSVGVLGVGSAGDSNADLNTAV